MKRRYRFTRSLAGAATLLSAGGLAGFQIAAAPSAAAATPITSTWSGLSTSSSNWSDAANWSTANGDQAPSSGSTISTLTFPDLPTCDNGTAATGSACNWSNNDLAGVTVGDIKFQTGSISPYQLDGTDATGAPVPLTLSGGVTVTPTSTGDFPATMTLPLTLSGAASAWSVPGSTLIVSGNVTGSGTQVNAAVSNNANLELDGNVQTSQFNLTGSDTTLTGINAGQNGILELNDPTGGPSANLNGANSPAAATDGNSVNITNAAVSGGGSVGSLSVTGGDVGLDYQGTPTVLNTGGATFDSSSTEIDFDLNGKSGSTSVTPGTDYSQLTASAITPSSGPATSGAINLNGAAISLSFGGTTCVDPTPGTVYTLMQGTSLTGTASYDYGNGSIAPLSPGSVVSIGSCSGSSYNEFAINYTSTSLTATALDNTTTTLTANPSSPQVNQSVVLTAAVTSSSGAIPTGTVTFYENNGNSAIQNCSDKPLDASGKATCTTSFSTTGDPGIGAGYTPDPASDFASSGNGPSSPFTVQAAPSTTPSSQPLYEVALQANGGHLWTVSSAGSTDLGVGMAPGTSPSIVTLSNGGYEMAFQSNGGQLWTVGTAGWTDWGVGMAPGTSPSMVKLPNGGYEVAFQAAGGQLWTVGTAGWKDWGLGVADATSPSIVPVGNGGYEVAFQAAGGALWTVGNAGWDDWGLGMANATGPSIMPVGNGGYEVAFQSNGGQLWTVGTAGWKDWGLGMAPGTSPSIVQLAIGGYEVAFQASGGALWTVGNAGWTSWPTGMASATGPATA